MTSVKTMDTTECERRFRSRWASDATGNGSHGEWMSSTLEMEMLTLVIYEKNEKHKGTITHWIEYERGPTSNYNHTHNVK